MGLLLRRWRCSSGWSLGVWVLLRVEGAVEVVDGFGWVVNEDFGVEMENWRVVCIERALEEEFGWRSTQLIS